MRSSLYTNNTKTYAVVTQVQPPQQQPTTSPIRYITDPRLLSPFAAVPPSSVMALFIAQHSWIQVWPLTRSCGCYGVPAQLSTCESEVI